MGLGVTTNVTALAVQRNLARSGAAATTALARLASGLRVTSAADDAAGLSVAEGLRSQVGGATVAARNAQDGIDLLRTADGALAQTTAVLQRMRDLSVQEANAGTLDRTAVEAVRTELDGLREELDRIAGTTTSHGIRLLDGSYDRAFQVGSAAGDTVRVTIPPTGAGLDSAGLGVSRLGLPAVWLSTTVTRAVSDDEGTPAPARMVIAGDYVSPATYAAAYRGLAGTVTYRGRVLDLESVDHTGAGTAQDHLDRLDAAAVQAFGTGFVPFTATATGLHFVSETPAVDSTVADAALLAPSYRGRAATGGDIAAIDRAITRVSSVRAHLGAVQNGLEHTVHRLGVAAENAAAAESRIRDADVAAEVAALSRARVLTDAGAALMAQANQSASALLRLLA